MRGVPPPQSLVTAVKDRTLVPFVGTGLSMSVGKGVFPSWGDLIERLAKRLVDESRADVAATVRAELAEQHFPEAAESAFETLSSSRFLEEMQAAFGIPCPPTANLSAVEALWRLRAPAVITTNYDTVLQWPFAPRADRPYPVNRVSPQLVYNDDPDLLRLVLTPSASTPPLIWHLHGTVLRPSTVILTRRQYERLYGDDKDQSKTRLSQYRSALAQLRSVVANRTLLFVGFSLDDPFVRAQLQYIFDITSKQNPVSFVLLKRGEKEKEEKEFLDRYNAQAIRFDDFGPPMVRAISEIADEAWGPTSVSVTVPGALVGLLDDLNTLIR